MGAGDFRGTAGAHFFGVGGFGSLDWAWANTTPSPKHRVHKTQEYAIQPISAGDIVPVCPNWREERPT
jgi:hypothetical protein